MKESSRRRFLQRTAAASIGVAAAGRCASAEAQSVALAGSSYVGARKVLLWESTRKEFREAVEGTPSKR